MEDSLRKSDPKMVNKRSGYDFVKSHQQRDSSRSISSRQQANEVDNRINNTKLKRGAINWSRIWRERWKGTLERIAWWILSYEGKLVLFSMAKCSLNLLLIEIVCLQRL